VTGDPGPVTIVANEIGPPGGGGMESQLAVLVGGLLERGHEVTAVSRRCELPEHPRLRRAPVRGPARPFTLAYPLFLLLGTLAVRRHRRGIVHTTGAIVLNRADACTVHLCHAAYRARGGPLRASRRGPAHRLNARLAAAMAGLGERLCYRPSRTRALVAVSEGVAAELRRHFPDMSSRLEVIANGVDRRRFAPDPESRGRVRGELGLNSAERLALFVGSEWEGKGLELAIEAAARAPGWRLAVAGDGDRGRYREIAARLGAAERILFLGRVEDPAPLYAAADAFLLPSAYESFSLVTFEAAASGLPLLVAPVSGAEDLVRDGESGWLVPRDADAIAGRLRELEADTAMARAMGERARQATAPYEWEVMVGAYSELYAELGPEPG
jgi:glycosyltransferase involved in cell wall biosynthesis